jgi:hypothetical protein
LGAAGGAAVFLSLVLITVAAMRKGPQPVRAYGAAQPNYLATATVTRPGVTADTVELGRKSVEAATGIVRDGSREAMLATLAATVVIGMLLGRRR